MRSPNERPVMEMRNKIANILTGLYGSTCCHRTGGYGGKTAEKGCACLDAADQIIAIPEFARMRQVLGECANERLLAENRPTKTKKVRAGRTGRGLSLGGINRDQVTSNIRHGRIQ